MNGEEMAGVRANREGRRHEMHLNVVVSSSGTGAGKTLVSQALCVALRRCGRVVAPYKVGPDYIDAAFYEHVAGRRAHNVDLWLDGEDGVRALVAATRGNDDVALFEGMMGLYDGDDDGVTSTAGVAKALGAEVVLVLDVWTMSQTAAAVAQGLRAYDPDVRIAGVVLNRVGGASHERAVRAALRQVELPVIGVVPYDEAYRADERRLGLDPAGVQRRIQAVERLGERIAAEWDLDAFAARESAKREQANPGAPIRARIAVADDSAFWFTYPESLLALHLAGAETVPFSPLHDEALPSGVDGLWIGGGYPEEHAAALAANAAMRRSIAAAVGDGIPTYAECGGLMYLADALETAEGSFAMCAAIAGTTSMRAPRLHLGYRRARTVSANPFDAAGDDVRGYEFHYAVSDVVSDQPAYRFADEGTDGVGNATLLASFLHRHFLPGSPAVGRFVAQCAQESA